MTPGAHRPYRERGTRAGGTGRRALLGSVAEEGMRNAPVPVLIVREGIAVPRAETVEAAATA